MIDKKTASAIVSQTQAYWDAEVKKEYFRGIAKGKEVGHRIADLVEEKTTALLQVNHLTAFERNAVGGELSRGMGDIWLKIEQHLQPHQREVR